MLDRLRVAWILCAVLGVGFIITGSIAPNIQLNGMMHLTGPKQSNSGFSYVIDVYETPPINPNQQITMIATKGGTGNVTIQISNRNPNIKELPESYIFSLNSVVNGINTSIPIYQEGSYLIMVTSYGASYSIYLFGRWEELYWLGIMLIWGIILVLASAFIYYYWRIVEARNRDIARALEAGLQSGE
ncbi:MAG: hypothetical protein QXR69_01490 [Conexivisphaerales archaeon]